MKKLAIAAMVVMSAVASYAADLLPQGMHEFRVDGCYDFVSADNLQIHPITGQMGYFPWDNVEMGMYVSYRKADWNSYFGPGSVWGLGGFAQYNITWGTPVVPFIGVRVGLLDGEQNSDTVFNIGGGPGVRLFLTETVSLYLAGEIDWASEDIYDFDRVGSKTDGDDMDVLGDGSAAEFTAKAGFGIIF